MRRLLLLLPLLIAGCAPGRQAAVSNTGEVASTAQGGTFVAGKGRIGDEGEDVAWSPDGSTLAYSAKDATVLWPKGVTIPKMEGALAWSPDGKYLAGRIDYNVGVFDLATGKSRETQTLLLGTVGIRWMPDGRVLVVGSSGFQIEGMRPFSRDTGVVHDAVPQTDGTVVWLESAPLPKRASAYLEAPLLLGRWNPKTEQATITKVGTMGSLLGVASPRHVLVPSWIVLSPDGSRYALAGLIAETGERNLARLKALADKENPTKPESAEFDRLIKDARIRSVVVRKDLSGGSSTTLWSENVKSEKDGPTDLSWSPDGRWLAIARNNGTVRVATE